MFAQVARFRGKKERQSVIKSEITRFREAVKTEGIPIKSELVLHNREHDIWIAIALFESKSDLDEFTKHDRALSCLENLRSHADGDIILYEAEVF